MKYEFANVLVADARLLIDMGQPGSSQPRVLVLNNRLQQSKWQRASCDKQRTGQSLACANCCLRIEEPEFRRRTSELQISSSSFPADEDEDDENTETEDQQQQQQQQCFANCSSDRRFVNIELNTATQIQGKLVLLALTKGLPNALMNEASSASLKCQTATSWFYSLFDQQQRLNQHDKVATGASAAVTQTNARQLTQYSRFKPNQLASLRIDSLEISWNSKLRRELVSIDIQSPGRSRLRKEQQQQQQQKMIYTNETLLVSELSCRSGGGGGDIGSVAWLGKIHLLALINREVSRSSHVKQTPIKSPNQSGSSTKPPTRTTQVSISAAADEDKTTEDSGSSIGTTIDRRSSGNFLQPPSRQSPGSSSNQAQNQTGADAMMDGAGNYLAAGGHTSRVASGNTKWTTATSDLNGRQLHELDTQLGDSIRMRLKSSGFLLFTVSSSFVILAYTLCLLIYLRGRSGKRPIRSAAATAATTSPRRRTQQQTNQKSSSAKGNKNSAAAAAAASLEVARQQMRISAPYNLQMSEPTRTRLDMMLRQAPAGKRKTADVATSLSSGQHPLLHSVAGAADRECKSRKRRRASNMIIGCCHNADPVPGAAHCIAGPFGASCMALAEQEPVYHCASNTGSADFSLETCAGAADAGLGYGTLQVVRAIRRAAAVARVKLKSRYEPNLNVIQESDVEHLAANGKLPSSAATRVDGETRRCRFVGENLDQRQQQEDHGSQIDHLVRDALNLECSHFIDRIQQPCATLFSRPSAESSPSSAAASAAAAAAAGATADREQVSRSGILKYVKENS